MKNFFETYGLALLAAVVVAAAADPALAQMITVPTGGIDPQVATQNFYTWAGRVAGGAICIGGLVTGSHATHARERILSTAGGIVGGSAIAFGTPYFLQNWH